MQIHYYPSSEQPVNNWSGGSTRQLAIYPLHSELSKRDFIFRISTATVEVESSVFSKFDGFKRILMILEGELEIYHQDHHSKHLHRFDTDHFEGSWETRAEGKVVDFNVIYSDKVKHAGVKKYELSIGSKQIFKCNDNDFIAFYILSGYGEVENNPFSEKDFLLIKCDSGKNKVQLEAHDNCIFILININFDHS